MLIQNAPKTPKTRAQKSQLRQQEALLAYLLILPSTLGILVFAVFPILASMGISMTSWGGLTQPTFENFKNQFTGLQNYQTALSDDRVLRSISHTLTYVLLSVPVGVAVSLGIATLIHNLKSSFLKTFFRTTYYLPMVTIGVAVALLWQLMLNPQGLINLMLGWFGIKGPSWLASPEWVLPAIALFSVWQGSGTSIILFLTALSNVNKELYEAAQLDGATGWNAFLKITFPMISPTLFLVLVLSLISSLQVFDAVLVMTNGGPGDSSTTIAVYIYKTAFQYFKYGYSAALAWILSVFLIVLTLVQWRMQRGWVNHDQQ
ncbi:carbohydrate ABC transporter permease [Deinococcus misasensis]|uniref:carbohydrate ABC transporter permease n=1 Tax=Deinococcus misasensis TaxID=392413 RepID=UPI00068FBE86|nr:sugar ABC transporter permease [Deinococcus misasensis]